MSRADNYRKAFLSMMFMFMALLSYGPMTLEIHALYTNATTTNAVIAFLESWFGIFWALLVVFFLLVALYQIIASI